MSAAVAAANETAETRVVYGCAGAVRLLAGLYLVVITSRTRVGRVCGEDVFEATAFDVVTCAAPGEVNKLSPPHLRRDETRYVRMLRAALTRKITKHMYFSRGYDLTRNLQRQREDRVYRDGESVGVEIAGGEDEKEVTAAAARVGGIDGGSGRGRGGWRGADKRFCWNRHTGETLVAAAAAAEAAAKGVGGASSVSDMIVPLMCGSFGAANIAHAAPAHGLDDDDAPPSTSPRAPPPSPPSHRLRRHRVVVIARTCAARVGIRHHCRGSDTEGEAGL